MFARPLLHAVLGLLALAGGSGTALAAQCALPSRAGLVSGLSGVANTYFPGTLTTISNGTTISLGAAIGANSSITAGDLLLVIQMQDAVVDFSNTATYGSGAINNAGVYEFVRAASTVGTGGGLLTIVGGTGAGLANIYTNADSTATSGQRRFQVIRVPQYSDLTLAGTVTAPAWNGSAGGVVVLDVAGTLNLNGATIDVAGRGFRGGGGRQLSGGTGANTDYRTLAAVNTNGAKGEGIAGTPRFMDNGGVLLDTGLAGYPNGTNGRGAPATGGGGGTDGNPAANDQNSGGGGGASYGNGGLGGHSWCPNAPVGCPQSGGFGGRGLTTSLSVSRLVMGGGGGAGTSNNGTGTPAAGFASSGAAGGGLVIIRTDRLRGSGTILANGASANNSVGNDASGGGGAGGSVLVSALDSTGASVSVNARGGNGGTNTPGGTLAHGPGGGGGGGFVASSFALTSNVAGGVQGTTENGGTFGASYGATGGNGGAGLSIVTSAIPGISSGAECTPVIAKAFSPSPITTGGTARLTLTVTNRNPTVAMSNVAFTDGYPGGLVNTAAPAASTSCAGTLTAAPDAASIALAGGNVAAASSCAVAVNVTAATAGDLVNTLAPGALTAAFGGQPTSSLLATSATLRVLAPLTAAKTNAAYWDPINLFNNPKAIPRSLVTYTIRITNPTAQQTDADSVSVSDAIPINTTLVVSDFGAAGSGPIAMVQGTPVSGLTYTFGGLGSLTDDLEFSSLAAPSQNVASDWSYVPVAQAGGIDPNVRWIRVRPKSRLVGGGSFSIQFRALVQ